MSAVERVSTELPWIPKSKDISQLANNINERFPIVGDQVGRANYRHSNDLDRMHSWQLAYKMLGDEMVSPGYHRVGLIVGTGGWQSTLPELAPKLDAILFTDINPVILRWISFTSYAMQQCETRKEYTDMVYESNDEWKNAIKPDYRGWSRDNMEKQLERESFGNFHLLYSDERYSSCRDAYLEAIHLGKQFLPTQIDLTRLEDVVDLRKILNDMQSKIVYVNLTNVADYIVRSGKRNYQTSDEIQNSLGQYRESLLALPLNDTCVIESSRYTSIKRGLDTLKCPMMRDPYLGISAYLAREVDGSIN